MLFITNRWPEGSVEPLNPGQEREFEFNLERTAPSNHVFFCRRDENGIMEMASAAWMDRIKESRCEQILFFIHGYSNLPSPDIFPRAGELQVMLEPDGILVVPVIWPCAESELLDIEYWDDQDSAAASNISLSRALQKFIDWRGKQKEGCFKYMNVLAHSMGSLVLREALFSLELKINNMPLLFRNTFLMASDIVNETLEKGERGHVISQASKNVSVYYAGDDMSLRASKVANLRNGIASRRLGHTGPEDMARAPKNVYGIDCDRVNNQYDFPKGHTLSLIHI